MVKVKKKQTGQAQKLKVTWDDVCMHVWMEKKGQIQNRVMNWKTIQQTYFPLFCRLFIFHFSLKFCKSSILRERGLLLFVSESSSVFVPTCGPYAKVEVSLYKGITEITGGGNFIFMPEIMAEQRRQITALHWYHWWD